MRYRFFAEEAEDQGFSGLTALFRAASDAEYYHARNHFYVNDGIEPLAEMVEGSIGRESHEVEHMYREYLDYSEKNNQGLARYTFFDALAAERVHRELFRKARLAVEKGEDIPVETYCTCTSCGYTFAGDEHPSRCPICGALRGKIRTVELTTMSGSYSRGRSGAGVEEHHAGWAFHGRCTAVRIRELRSRGVGKDSVGNGARHLPVRPLPRRNPRIDLTTQLRVRLWSKPEKPLYPREPKVEVLMGEHVSKAREP